jgi:predicted HTH domain antitoxin
VFPGKDLKGIKLTTGQAHITIDMPADIAGILNRQNTDLQKEIKQYLALKLYQQSLLTIGKAAELAGMNKRKRGSNLSKHWKD